MSAPSSRFTSALADRYRIERELGGGGMSRVWVATETALDRQVVIKVIAAELTEGASAERFAREVRLAARLQQANIVPVLNAGTADGLPYYTMPYVRGRIAPGPARRRDATRRGRVRQHPPGRGSRTCLRA
jgi:serine/threonine-protein kinase